MQILIDFLSFRFFISGYVLFICYYVGAIAVPVVSWLLAVWLKRKFGVLSNGYDTAKQAFVENTRDGNRFIIYALFAMLFICMEIVWRMMFEFIFAYLQMHEAILLLAEQK